MPPGFYSKQQVADFEKFKNYFFHSHPDEPIILHRSEIIHCEGAFKVLKDDKYKDKFNTHLLKKLEEWDYKVISVLIDKKEHIETYKVWRYDPYHYCLKILLERYIFFLEEKESVGDVMVESRGRVEDERLKDSYERIYKNGTEYLNEDRFKERLTSERLKVKPKIKNITGLQIADMIAHPSRRDIFIVYSYIKKPKPVFGDYIIKVLREGKYYTRFGYLKGYGLKKLP